MKKYMLLLIPFALQLQAQELFVFTEPASNMASGTAGVRMNNYLMKENASAVYEYHLLPEVMLGISKKIMLHGEMFFNSRDHAFQFKGGSLYGKYRFFSKDDVHSHFRIAAFGRYSFNKGIIEQAAIDLLGHNSGFEGGVVVTKLINRTAISAGSSFLHATDNGSHLFRYSFAERNAVNYSVSGGQLILPKEYSSYKQTNLNLMCELLGQVNPGNGRAYFDLAPSAQLIFKSRIRFDLGYRWPLVKNLYRTAPGGFLIRLEYNFFNVLK